MKNYLQLSILIIQDWKKLKNFIIQGKYYYAVNELLEYYRNRTKCHQP